METGKGVEGGFDVAYDGVKVGLECEEIGTVSSEIIAPSSSFGGLGSTNLHPHLHQRQKWTSQVDYVLSLMGFAVGLGNLWRFPYLCFKNGGGAFFIPYLIFMFTCGAPLFFLESSLGQLTQNGVLKCWNLVPLFKGFFNYYFTFSS